MRAVAEERGVGFADVYEPMRRALADARSDLTFNGAHLTEEGYAIFADALVPFGVSRWNRPSGAVDLAAAIREAVVDKNRQFFRRYRPLNTYYYTGNRRGSYGSLDFLPAMQSFDVMVANRDQRIWDLAAGRPVPPAVDDSNVPPLPAVPESRGANQLDDGGRGAARVPDRFALRGQPVRW